jgi:beta-N-acetylhexosaminidase
MPVVDADLATLRSRDLPPFAAAVEAGVRSVLTAHVLFPPLDDRPATMSPPLLHLLRRDLGFDGVVISDAVDMQAIAGTVGRGPGAVAAVAAGVDLVCIGNPSNGYDDEAGYLEVRHALLDALADGSLPRARLADAGRRVAELAGWVRRAADAAGAGYVPEHLGHEVVRRVAEVSGDVRVAPGPHVLDLTGPANVAAGLRREPLLPAALRRRDPEVTTGRALPDAGRPLVVVATGPTPELDTVRTARPDAVVVNVGFPGRWTPPPPSVTVWGDGRAQAEVAAELLKGR